MIRVIKVFAEAIFWAMIGIGALWLTLPSGFDLKPTNLGGLFANDFARRWDATCAGWTRPLATFHIISDLLLWNAYVVIALVMWRLHPIIKRVPTHRITVSVICLIFLTCGATHLFSAYAAINPIYVFDGAFKTLAGVIGAFGAVYIAHDLVTVYDVIEDEHYRLKVLEAKLARNTNATHSTRVKRNQRGRIVRAIMEGLLWSLLGLLLWLLPTTPITEGFFRNDFASQWTGACTGWTKPLAMLHIIGSWITWSAYVLIGIVVFRLHPISKKVQTAKIMVPAVSAVLVTCGVVHLFDAYTIFNPIYVASAWFKLFVAGVSLTGAVLVSQTLVTVFDAAVKERRRLAELEAQLVGAK